MLRVFNEENAKIIGNMLLPGDGKQWICFSSAIINGINIEVNISSDEVFPIDIYEYRISAPGADLVAETVAFEASEPALFAKIYRSFLDAYYGSPAVVARVVEVANQAPREAEAIFDAALLDDVLAKGAGKRRL